MKNKKLHPIDYIGFVLRFDDGKIGTITYQEQEAFNIIQKGIIKEINKK